MYKITAVSPQVREYETKFGQMKSYKVKFDGSDEIVEISQKDSTPAPQVGQEVEGTITDTEYGKKFKKSFGQGGFQGGKKTEDPARQDSIIRQSSLKAAVELVVADKVKFTELFDFADEVVKWVKDEAKVSFPELPKEEPKKKVEFDEEIDLSDLPF